MASTQTSHGRAWWGAAFFFGALCLANVLPVVSIDTDGALEHVERIAFGLAFFLVWVAAIGRVRWAVVAAAALFVWWWPVELYLRWTYAAPVSAEFVGLAAETQRRELLEFLSVFHRELIAGVVLAIALAAIGVASTWRSAARWTHRSRWWCLIVFPVVAVGMHQLYDAQEPDWLAGPPDPLRVAPLAFWSEKWRTVFPLTLPLALQRYEADARRVAGLRERVRDFHFGAMRSPSAADVVVLVIGESSRADRWSLAGYARETNPLLARRPHLVFFKDVVTPATSTRLAVPAIVSRRPAIGADGRVRADPEPSLVAAFREAGYRTAWLSTQAPSGFWDTSTMMYAQDAQVVRFLNPAAAAYRGAYDDVLLAPAKEFAGEPGPAMLVLHTLGSHFDYEQRYPAEFARFGTASRSDAYDNTIVYTDHFLDALMRELEAGGRRALVFYVSDHGEDVAGGQCPTAGVTRASAASYRVPALVWMSDALARERPEQLALLRSRAGAAWESTATWATLLDLAGVAVPSAHTEDAARTSLLSPQWRPAPRKVADASGTWIDFDRAEKNDRCHLRAAAPAATSP